MAPVKTVVLNMEISRFMGETLRAVMVMMAISILPAAGEDDWVCSSDENCQVGCCLNFGMMTLPHCCSKTEGFILLGLMIGGGVIFAFILLACYLAMRRSETELHAAARLEEAKAVNRAFNNNSSSTHSSPDEERPGYIDDGEHPDSPTRDSNLPPPAYNDVVREFAVCQPRDSQPGHNPNSNNDCAHIRFDSGRGRFGDRYNRSNSLNERCSDGNRRINEIGHNQSLHRYPLYDQQSIQHLFHLESSMNSSAGLPALVDINQFLAQHRLENFTASSQEFQVCSDHLGHSEPWRAPSQAGHHQMLPPPVSESEQWNKLPTYEEYCVSPSQPPQATETVSFSNTTELSNSKSTQNTSATSACETSSLRRPMEVGHVMSVENKHESFINCTDRMHGEPKACPEPVMVSHTANTHSGDPDMSGELCCSVNCMCTHGQPCVAQCDGTGFLEPVECQDRVRHSLIKLPSIEESDEEDRMAHSEDTYQDYVKEEIAHGEDTNQDHVKEQIAHGDNTYQAHVEYQKVHGDNTYQDHVKEQIAHGDNTYQDHVVDQVVHSEDKDEDHVEDQMAQCEDTDQNHVVDQIAHGDNKDQDHVKDQIAHSEDKDQDHVKEQIAHGEYTYQDRVKEQIAHSEDTYQDHVKDQRAHGDNTYQDHVKDQIAHGEDTYQDHVKEQIAYSEDKDQDHVKEQIIHSEDAYQDHVKEQIIHSEDAYQDHVKDQIAYSEDKDQDHVKVQIAHSEDTHQDQARDQDPVEEQMALSEEKDQHRVVSGAYSNEHSNTQDSSVRYTQDDFEREFELNQDTDMRFTQDKDNECKQNQGPDNSFYHGKERYSSVGLDQETEHERLTHSTKYLYDDKIPGLHQYKDTAKVICQVEDQDEDKTIVTKDDKAPTYDSIQDKKQDTESNLTRDVDKNILT